MNAPLRRARRVGRRDWMAHRTADGRRFSARRFCFKDLRCNFASGGAMEARELRSEVEGAGASGAGSTQAAIIGDFVSCRRKPPLARGGPGRRRGPGGEANRGLRLLLYLFERDEAAKLMEAG